MGFLRNNESRRTFLLLYICYNADLREARRPSRNVYSKVNLSSAEVSEANSTARSTNMTKFGSEKYIE